MKGRIIFLVTFLVLLLAGEAFGQACKNIGAKECRVTTPGKCHWWVCDGQAKQWIFTGQSCTCPRADAGLFEYALCDENELPGFVLAQKAYLCRDSENVRLIKEATKKCVPEARTQDPQFTAFLNPDNCGFDINGGYNRDAFWAAVRVFNACMKENGISMSDNPNKY